MLPLLLLAVTAARDPVTVTVTVQNVQSTQGQVAVAVYGRDGFPKKGEQLMGVMVPATSPEVTARLEGIPPGTWAIAVFHDLDGDDTLDSNFIGYPTEPFTFSGEPMGRLSPPSFDKAKVTLTADTAITVNLGS